MIINMKKSSGTGDCATDMGLKLINLGSSLISGGKGGKGGKGK